jgi:hypothetical protein
MSANTGKSMGWMIVLILFGVAALIGGVKWLVVLIPAATLVWFGAAPTLRNSRH